MWYITLSTLWAVGQSAIVIHPVNTAAQTGSTVVLRCSSDAGATIRWDYEMGSRQHAVFTGTAVHRDLVKRYRVASNQSTGQCDLTISHVTLTDAGVYSCFEQGHSDRQQSALLVVLDAVRCASNFSADRFVGEFERVSVNCSLTYSGRWTPNVECWSDTTRQQLVTTWRSDDTTDNQTVEFSAQTTVVSTLSGSTFTCRVQFPAANRPPSLSKDYKLPANVPDFVRQWKSPLLSVTYGPRSVGIRPQKSNYRQGETLRCDTEANPDPDFEWTDSTTGDVIGSGQQLRLVGCQRGTTNNERPLCPKNVTVTYCQQSVTCSATVTANGNRRTVTANFTLNVSSNVLDCYDESAHTGSDVSMYIISGLVALLVVSIFAIIMLICRRRSGRRSTDKVPTTVHPTYTGLLSTAASGGITPESTLGEQSHYMEIADADVRAPISVPTNESSAAPYQRLGAMTVDRTPPTYLPLLATTNDRGTNASLVQVAIHEIDKPCRIVLAR